MVYKIAHCFALSKAVINDNHSGDFFSLVDLKSAEINSVWFLLTNFQIPSFDLLSTV